MLHLAANGIPVLWFLIVLAVALGLAFFLQQKRRKDLERVAMELGLQFVNEQAKLPVPNEVFGTLPLLKRSSDRSNFLHGTRATGEMFLADVRVGHGKNARTQTVGCYHLKDRRLPAFQLSPESWGAKIAQAFGYKDIDFESSPEFSNSYALRGEDEAAVRELFSADVLNHFTGEKGWTVEGEGEWLCVYRSARRVSPKDIRTFLEQTEAVAQQFARKRW